MKVSFPLSLKVSLWLLFNLAVLFSAAVIFVTYNYGIGWQPLFASPAGARVQDMGRLVSADLRSNPEQSVDDVLRRYTPGAGIDLFLFLNEGGRQLGGPSVQLPPSVRAPLIGPTRPRDSTGRPRLPFSPPSPGRNRDRPPRAFGQRLPALGQRNPWIDQVVSAGRPVNYWILVRIPVVQDDAAMPARGTLIVRVHSKFAMFRLLTFGPWIAAVAAAFVLSAICWLPFVSGLRRALLAITHATGRIAEGQFETRVRARRRDELGALGHAVNQMAGRLEAQVQTQKRFLGDVAHELGTPVARLQVAIELLERKSAPALRPQIADVREEVEQISNLVNELLAFTKAGLRRRDTALERVELAAVVARVLDREDARRCVKVEITPGASVLADAVLLERALGNLVRNALRYAPNSAIGVSAQDDGDEVVIRVSDSGPGVPSETLDRLGEPFFRPDTARTRETGGNGLGLAIVRTCIEACSGSVVFLPGVPSGFIAEIRLRRAS